MVCGNNAQLFEGKVICREEVFSLGVDGFVMDVISHGRNLLQV